MGRSKMAGPDTIEYIDRMAHRYEERWKSYLTHTHNVFLHHLSTSEEDRILDPSCGTGLLALEILESGFPFESMVLNDPSEKMLATARNRLPGHPSITFSSHPAEMLPHNRHTFSSILCLNAFHNYRDQDAVLTKFHSLLEPGGSLYILDWNREGLFRLINSVIRWYVPETINTRSATEMEKMIGSHSFSLLKLDTWRFRYWNFLFLKAVK